jgi:hypothetical protein
MIDKKAIWVTQETMTRFNGFGIRGETADQLLNFLMDAYDQYQAEHGFQKARVE